jgi:hypothetical protein
MFLAGFHALGANCPEFVAYVELGAARTDDFAGSPGRQNREFQRTRGDSLLRSQADQERREFGVWQCAVMLGLANFRAPRQRAGFSPLR